MIAEVFIFGAVILVAMVIVIRRYLAQLEAQAKIIAQSVPDTGPPEPDDSFDDDRIVTGQLVPIGEHHCRASGGRGKRKAWRKTPKGKRRDDWSREEAQ